MSGPSSDDDNLGILADPDEDPHPHEPDEPDPHDIGPSVDVPEPPDPTETDATLDPRVKLLFWKLVVTFNVALLGLSLGPMLLYFRGELRTGGAVFAVGVLTFAYGYWTYRRYEAGEVPRPADETDEIS